MRIVHIVQCLGIGGQERLIQNLSRALAARGHDVTVLSLTPGGELRHDFGPIAVLDAPRRPGLDALLPVGIGRVLARLRPHAVHTHNPSPMLYGALAARATLVRRVVHTKHGKNVYSTRSLALARAVVRTLSAFVAVSRETADVALTKERVPRSLLTVVPNGIPLDEFHPDAQARRRLRAELGIPQDAFVVGSVGRLAEEKDYPFVVRAMAPLLGARTRLVIVGGGPTRSDIQSAIPADRTAFVSLTGMRHDIPALLASFDVFALGSRTEGLPLVVPEAMASGLPIVATAVGGLPSVVPAEVGRLVPHGDENALARAVLHFHDPVHRERAAKAALAHAHARFSIDTMTDAYEDLYHREDGAPASR